MDLKTTMLTFGIFRARFDEKSIFFLFLIRVVLQAVLQVLTGHSAPVVGVDYHPSLNIIATSSLADDCSVRLWRSDVQKEKE